MQVWEEDQMSKIDREICSKATPGPWIRKESGICTIGIGPVRSHIHDALCDENSGQDLEFVLHFNPSKVSEMLDRIEELEKRVYTASECIRTTAGAYQTNETVLAVVDDILEIIDPIEESVKHED
jgi:hypothetical protein